MEKEIENMSEEELEAEYWRTASTSETIANVEKRHNEVLQEEIRRSKQKLSLCL